MVTIPCVIMWKVLSVVSDFALRIEINNSSSSSAFLRPLLDEASIVFNGRICHNDLVGGDGCCYPSLSVIL